MDSITQAALGAVVGELVLGRKLGRPAIAWGALFGTVPDLDAVLLVFLDTHWDLRLHRGFTHALLVMVLASWGLAKPLAKRWKKKKITPGRAGAFVFAVWSTHVLIDCFTVYGTQVLWPFSMHPVSFDNLFIIDPLFTLPLLVAVVWGLCIDFKKWKKGVGIRMVWTCLAISCAYVGLSFGAKQLVRSAMAADLDRRGIAPQRIMEAPAPFSIVLWRGVVEREEDFLVGYRSVFDGERPMRWMVLPKDEAAFDAWKAEPEVRTVRWFSKGWSIARPNARGVWMADLRFGEYREWDRRGLELRPTFAWEFRQETRGDRLKRPDRERDMGAMLKRLWSRMWGPSDGWDGPPRLIGNPAVPQEYLETLEGLPGEGGMGPVSSS